VLTYANRLVVCDPFPDVLVLILQLHIARRSNNRCFVIFVRRQELASPSNGQPYAHAA
jgi:hypothetical protein